MPLPSPLTITASGTEDFTLPTELRWKASLSATCMHAALCQRAGVPAADEQVAAALDRPIADLLTEIQEALWPLDATLAQLASLSAEYENNVELVTRVVARLRIETAAGLIKRVAGALADVETALHRARPEIVEELAVRGGPLRQQWDARGPGMLREIARLTDESVVPESAEVVLVAPYVGGHGLAHPAQNRVTIEAVLVNPHPDLPEAVRLAWLVSQLNGDLPPLADVLPADVRARIVPLAMLAPAVAAGAAVELTADGEAAVESALDAWRVRADLPADVGAKLWQWWSAWVEGAGRWPVAVAALAQMLR